MAAGRLGCMLLGHCGISETGTVELHATRAHSHSMIFDLRIGVLTKLIDG